VTIRDATPGDLPALEPLWRAFEVKPGSRMIARAAPRLTIGALGAVFESAAARLNPHQALIDTTGNYTAVLVASTACFTAAAAILLRSHR